MSFARSLFSARHSLGTRSRHLQSEENPVSRRRLRSASCQRAHLLSESTETSLRTTDTDDLRVNSAEQNQVLERTVHQRHIPFPPAQILYAILPVIDSSSSSVTRIANSITVLYGDDYRSSILYIFRMHLAHHAGSIRLLFLFFQLF